MTGAEAARTRSSAARAIVSGEALRTRLYTSITPQGTVPFPSSAWLPAASPHRQSVAARPGRSRRCSRDRSSEGRSRSGSSGPRGRTDRDTTARALAVQPKRREANIYVYSCMRAFQGADGGSHVCLHCYRIFSFGYIVQGLQLSIYVGLVMVIQSALVRSHQSTSAGSFGLVRPTWIRY